MTGNVIHGTIEAQEVVLGEGVVIEEGVTISGVGGPAERIILGDNVLIGANSRIRVPVLEIGDYTQLHNHALVYGYEPVTIGHNGWIGQNVILNSTDRLTLGDNCGIGAYSQLWTHMRFGDVMEGCRYNSQRPLIVGKDVWFVGHCIVSPITAGDKSVAMVGSVVTRDMEPNHVYGGSPATDLTERLGAPYAAVPDEEKVRYLEQRINTFLAEQSQFSQSDFGIAAAGETIREGNTVFDVSAREYTKTGSEAEVAFMRFLLPDAKFTPATDSP